MATGMALIASAVAPRLVAPSRTDTPARTGGTTSLVTEHRAASAASGPNQPAPFPFADRLLEIARNYRSYTLVDDTLRWAPLDCNPPDGTVTPRLSGSGDARTHGLKLYYLFASDTYSYLWWRSIKQESPIGQVLVKEAWTPAASIPKGVLWTEEARSDLPLLGDGKEVSRYAVEDERVWFAETKAALFIMFKLDPGTPGTDLGWVYGTVTPDGRTVTSAGRVASCMKCHERAPHDRLFGLPELWEGR